MASVAADTSAIAPSLPLPSRSDAAPPAGPPGAFADLLDAQATATPPVQGPGPAPVPSAGAQDGANQGPSGAGPAPSKGTSGKDTSNSKPAKDKSDTAAEDSANGGSGANPTVAAGLAILPLTSDSALSAADQRPTASNDSQTGSPDPAMPVNDGSTSKSSDPSANAPSDPTTAGLVAAIPGLQTIVAASATPPSTGTSSALVGSSAPSLAATVPSTSAPPAGLDSATAGAASSPHAPVAAATQDLLVASNTPAADGQNISAPTLPAMVAGIGTSDQNPRSDPAAPFGVTATTNALASVAPISPLPVAPNAGSPGGADQTPANPGAARGSDAALIALPAQVAARFAASTRGTDDGTSDSSTDGWFGSAASAGDTGKSANDQPGTIQPSFNPTTLAPVQLAPGLSGTPQHAVVTPDAVPLAGIPIAIAARVEAGEKRFEIRLDPPDLGRIEVTLNVDSSGRATSHLVVDRADTLDLLRRDAPALERALQSAGLTTGDGALQFSLRDQSFAGRDQGTSAPLPSAAPSPPDNDLAPIDAAVRRYGAAAGLGSGVDIRV